MTDQDTPAGSGSGSSTEPKTPYHRLDEEEGIGLVSGKKLFSPTTPGFGHLADAENSSCDDDEDDSDHEGVFFLRSGSMGGGDSTDDMLVDIIGAGNNDNTYDGADDMRHHIMATSRLSLRNGLNLLAFGANVFIHYGIGVWGLNGILPTISEVTDTHRTLITPVDWTHWIWAVIYALEFVFVVAQLFPSYRSRPVVLQGVGYFFVYSCLAQIAWTMFFSFCMFLISFICQATNLASLCFLIISQFLSQSRNEGRLEYFLLRFPFSLHIGWVFVETAVNFSILSQHMGLSEGEQLCAVIVSLGLLLMVGSLFLGANTSKGLVVPAVMIWAFVGISVALNRPSVQIKDEFDGTIIAGVRAASLSFSIVIAAVLVPRLAFIIFKEYFTIRISEH
eukprot:CAMPEP_0197719548 /NCGR_PEP_ID=MMETSP1434-20131217/3259_1 /TAXON_ID=265543 /ORGANISM="Minutocellus polymorphus, Strain CCMP3303" /LENGTH=391 /DNA_ID=CAMNT_0043304305 /DNA_START=32 /DNA_END=1207 /DNA_ORIENTATION=+